MKAAICLVMVIFVSSHRAQGYVKVTALNDDNFRNNAVTFIEIRSDKPGECTDKLNDLVLKLELTNRIILGFKACDKKGPDYYTGVIDVARI